VNLPTESPSPGLVAVLAETFLKSHPLGYLFIFIFTQQNGFMNHFRLLSADSHQDLTCLSKRRFQRQKRSSSRQSNTML